MIEFTLPFPPSVNTLFPTLGKRRIKSKKYKAWINAATVAILQQDPQPIKERCVIFYSLDSPDKRMRDAGNYEKAVTDLLVARNIIKDDNILYLKGKFIYWNDKKGDQVTVSLVAI